MVNILREGTWELGLFGLKIGCVGFQDYFLEEERWWPEGKENEGHFACRRGSIQGGAGAGEESQHHW